MLNLVAPLAPLCGTRLVTTALTCSNSLLTGTLVRSFLSFNMREWNFDKIERKIKGHWRERGESWSKDCFIVAFTDKKFKQCVMSKKVEGKNHFFLTESFKFRLNLQFMTSPTSNYFPYAHNVCFRVCLLNFNFKSCQVFPHWNLLKTFALKVELKE